MLHLLSSLRIPEMLNSLSLGTEVAGTAKMSWAIFGRSVQKSPEVSYSSKYSKRSHYADISWIFLPVITRTQVGLTENSLGSSLSRASALSLSTNSTAFLSYKARSFPSLSALCGSAPDSELLEKRVLLRKGRPGTENSVGTSFPSSERLYWSGISSRSNQQL